MSFYYITSELSHHGVKGMKWGVRKADYNAKGMHSDIYSKISSLEWQEAGAKMENRKNYRTRKKNIKTELKEQKKAKKITKAEYRSKKNEGINAVKKVFRDNNNKIHSNFNKAYYDTINAGEIASARNWNSLGSLMGADSTYTEANKAKLNRAEARRHEFMNEYTMRNYNKKKKP